MKVMSKCYAKGVVDANRVGILERPETFCTQGKARKDYDKGFSDFTIKTIAYETTTSTCTSRPRCALESRYYQRKIQEMLIHAKARLNRS